MPDVLLKNQSHAIMNRKHFFIFFIFLSALFANAQPATDSLFAKFNLKWNKQQLVLNNKQYSKADSLEISVFKFYVSQFKIQFDDKSEFIQNNSYHLIDIDKPSSCTLFISKKTDKSISSISFCIGVDSLASVSGALSGDLDATKGMYWSWQSGYINMKIEGKSNSCASRKNSFQFHIGGYLPPNYAIKEVKIPISQHQILNNIIPIQVDLAKVFDSIQLSKINSVMIPGKEALKIADLSTKMFFIE